MPALTDQQAHFVHHFVSMGCTPTEAARAAGYGSPGQEAYRLMRKAHVIEAIRREQDRLINTDGVRIAYKTLVEVMQDKGAAASARVSASRTVWEAARLFSKDAGHRDDKPLQELSAEELADQIKRFDQALVQMTGSGAVN
ncbi:MAG: terminase small subunit [Novosphingobium sp.]|uniref:terminase small subunit n=1 Tax=Novosphingobium sp. TaxID=1874826 RepID=UPI003016F108